MIIPIKLNFDLIILIIESILAISALYSAWINLYSQRISNLGLDAFILLFFDRKKAKMIRGDPRLIRRMGIINLLIAIGAMNIVDKEI